MKRLSVVGLIVVIMLAGFEVVPAQAGPKVRFTNNSDRDCTRVKAEVRYLPPGEKYYTSPVPAKQKDLTFSPGMSTSLLFDTDKCSAINVQVYCSVWGGSFPRNLSIDMKICEDIGLSIEGEGEGSDWFYIVKQ